METLEVGLLPPGQEGGLSGGGKVAMGDGDVNDDDIARQGVAHTEGVVGIAGRIGRRRGEISILGGVMSHKADLSFRQAPPSLVGSVHIHRLVAFPACDGVFHRGRGINGRDRGQGSRVSAASRGR